MIDTLIACNMNHFLSCPHPLQPHSDKSTGVTSQRYRYMEQSQ